MSKKCIKILSFVNKTNAAIEHEVNDWIIKNNALVENIEFSPCWKACSSSVSINDWTEYLSWDAPMITFTLTYHKDRDGLDSSVINRNKRIKLLTFSNCSSKIIEESINSWIKNSDNLISKIDCKTLDSSNRSMNDGFETCVITYLKNRY